MPNHILRRFAKEHWACVGDLNWMPRSPGSVATRALGIITTASVLGHEAQSAGEWKRATIGAVAATPRQHAAGTSTGGITNQIRRPLRHHQPVHLICIGEVHRGRRPSGVDAAPGENEMPRG